MQSLLQLIHRHKSGEEVGIYSVCSANPWVFFRKRVRDCKRKKNRGIN
ncbi:MAG: class II D-tagatose-bisphosphate aldolase non-catalytic subunit [Candidatus Phlomobacter fragariae]